MSEHSNYFFLLLPKINKAKPKKKKTETQHCQSWSDAKRMADGWSSV
jgi:hypothetical protein